VVDVYFSHSIEDRDAVVPLMEAVRRANLTVWSSEDITPGTSVVEAVHHAIESARCWVFVWSNSAAQSTWAGKELKNLAIQTWSSDRLVLATLDETPLPVGLRDLSPIQITDGDDSGKQQLIERIKLVLLSDEQRDAAPNFSIVEAPVAAKRWRRGWLIGASTLFVGVLFVGIWAFHAAPPLTPQPAPPVTPQPAPPVQRDRPSVGFDGEDRSLQAVNESSAAITEIFAVNSDTADWSANLLGTSVVPPGGSHSIRTNVDRGYCKVDVVARFSDGTTELISNVNLCAVSRLVFDDNHRILRDGSPPPQAKTVPERGPDLLLPILGSAIGVLIGAAAVWILLSRRRQGVGTPAIQATLLMNVPEAPNPSSQVFISYSHQDEPAVDALVKQIEKLGHVIWIDRQSTGSQRYAGKIVEAIKKSRFVALMCSQNAFASDHVIREVYIAGDLKKPFIVFLLEPGDLPNDILYFVSGFPRITVTKMDVQTLRLEIARLVTN
jgi:hypothetical protein